MCIFGNMFGGGGGKAKTSNQPTVYDGQGRAKATDRSYDTVKGALRAQRLRIWNYENAEESEPDGSFQPTRLTTASGGDMAARRRTSMGVRV